MKRKCATSNIGSDCAPPQVTSVEQQGVSDPVEIEAINRLRNKSQAAFQSTAAVTAAMARMDFVQKRMSAGKTRSLKQLCGEFMGKCFMPLNITLKMAGAIITEDDRRSMPTEAECVARALSLFWMVLLLFNPPPRV